MNVKHIYEVETVEKGWGYEKIIANSPLYCQKILHIEKGKKLSTHFHRLKSEHFCVASGKIEIVIYTDERLDQYIQSWDNLYAGLPNAPPELEKPQKFIMEKFDSIFIPIGTRHTVRALETADIFEASTMHFDSDSFRTLKGD